MFYKYLHQLIHIDGLRHMIILVIYGFFLFSCEVI